MRHHRRICCRASVIVLLFMYFLTRNADSLVHTVPKQAKELLDHLESVLSNEPVEVVAGNAIVEVKPQGISKVRAVPATYNQNSAFFAQDHSEQSCHANRHSGTCSPCHTLICTCKQKKLAAHPPHGHAPLGGTLDCCADC